MSDQLKTLFCDSREVEFAGSKINVRNIALGDLPVLIEIIAKLFDGKTDLTNEKAIILAVTKDFGSILKIFEITTDLNADQIKKLNTGAATFILGEVVKENASFFQQHVLPRLQGLVGQMKNQKKVSGHNKSKS